MFDFALTYKGIHPGRVLERELRKRNLKQRPFAKAIQLHPQTLNAIIKGKRGVSTAIALRMEKELDLEEGSLVLLQAFYDIDNEKYRRSSRTPNFSILRKALFWDTDVDRLDWEKHYRAVIRRIHERGNQCELEEISRFYGAQRVADVLKNIDRPLTSH